MTMVEALEARVDDADLVILALVESVRGREQSATPLVVASQIRKAPWSEVARRMQRLVFLGALEVLPGSYALTPLGAELLAQDVIGWLPDPREQARRDRQALGLGD